MLHWKVYCTKTRPESNLLAAPKETAVDVRDQPPAQPHLTNNVSHLNEPAPGAGISPLDTSAVSLSVLCLVHCLALPLVSAFLPLAGVLAEAEWIHRAIVLIAVPITILALTMHSILLIKN